MNDRKFKVWLNSGANIHSCNEQIVTLKDLGLTSEEWDAMTDKEKEDLMFQVAFERGEWGYVEL